MANPIYQSMNPSKSHQGGHMAFIRKFPQFMDQMRGQDPSQLIQRALTSGQLSQAQLDQAQHMAHQLEGELNGFKSMFGFK